VPTTKGKGKKWEKGRKGIKKGKRGREEEGGKGKDTIFRPCRLGQNENIPSSHD